MHVLVEQFARTYAVTMKRTRGIGLTIVALVALSACTATEANDAESGAAAPAASTPAQTTPDATQEPEAQTIEYMASAAGITGFDISSEPAPAVISWGKGMLDGSQVRVYEFADDAGYDAFVASVAGFGITEDKLVKVGNFAFAPDDAAQVEQIRSAVG